MLTIYKASAGSGKTFTLALEYIKLLLGVKTPDGRYVLNLKKYLGDGAELSRPHERILAITFTNKATAEMKSRIIKELWLLGRVPAAGQKDGSAYAAKLLDIFGCTRGELAAVAKRTLHRLLYDYGVFNVSTIDSFFQTVLRSFAREVDRQGDFRVDLDELNVLSESVSLLFDEANAPEWQQRQEDREQLEGLKRWLMELADMRGRSGKDYNPFNRSSTMYRTLIDNLRKVFNESFAEKEAEMTEYLTDPHRIARFSEVLMQEVTRLKDYCKRISEAMSARLQDIEAAYKVLKDFVERVVSNLDKILEALHDSPIYIVNLDTRNNEKLFKAKPPVSEADVEAVFDWFAEVKDGAIRIRLLSELAARAHTIQALMHIRRYVERYRRENNLVLISDTNSLLGTIIRESDPPFLFERVGVRLENFMIDEFQDTSRLQWANLSPLVGNSLATETDSLIIGDVKQSIYRWRGAESALLDHEVRSEFRADQVYECGFRPGENTNYRSSHTVVRFNNTLFELLSTRIPPLPAGYTGLAQMLPDKTAKLSGRVRLWRPENQSGFTETTAVSLLGEETVEALQAQGVVLTDKTVAYELIAREIEAQISRGYRQRDIAILVRKNSQAVEIAAYLMANHPKISLVSEEALLLCNSRSVRIVIGMLELFDRGGEGSAQSAPEKAPLSAFPEVKSLSEQLADTTDQQEQYRLRRAITRRKRATIIDGFEYFMAHGHDVEQSVKLSLARAEQMYPVSEAETACTEQPYEVEMPESDIARIRSKAPSNLYALAEAIISEKISEEMQRAEMPYLTALLDIIDQYSRDNIASVNAFLRYWHQKESRFAIAADERQDAVSISTVHKAKGLEWDCVHVYMPSWELDAAAEEQWYDTDGAVADAIRALAGCDELEVPPMMFLSPDSVAFESALSPFRMQIARQKAESRADHLNTAYVAFTRAVRELHIYSMTAPSEGSLLAAIDTTTANPGWSDELIAASTSTGLADVYMRLGGNLLDNGFEYGSPTYAVAAPADEPTTDSDPSDPCGVSGSVAAAPIRVEFTELNQRMTRLADLTYADESADDPELGNTVAREIVDEPLNPAMEAAAREGLNLHSILSRMETIDDLDDAIAYHRRDLDDATLARYRARLEQAFSDGGDTVARWFAPENPQVLNEQPIYSRGSNYRADRIVWLPDGTVTVVDYKFTRERRYTHYTQVRDYATFLRESGYSPVAAYLWYPLRGEVIEVE